MVANLRIRPLGQGQDDSAVFDLFQRCADYVMLEEGQPPRLAKVNAFFTDIVPGGDLARAVKLGVERDGKLYGIADMGFGYPNPKDAYIGLLMLDPAVRDQGVGPRVLAHLSKVARERGAERLLVAVLQANPRGQAFWQREGFAMEKVFEPRAEDPVQHRRIRMTRAL